MPFQQTVICFTQDVAQLQHWEMQVDWLPRYPSKYLWILFINKSLAGNLYSWWKQVQNITAKVLPQSSQTYEPMMKMATSFCNSVFFPVYICDLTSLPCHVCTHRIPAPSHSICKTLCTCIKLYILNPLKCECLHGSFLYSVRAALSS